MRWKRSQRIAKHRQHLLQIAGQSLRNRFRALKRTISSQSLKLNRPVQHLLHSQIAKRSLQGVRNYSEGVGVTIANRLPNCPHQCGGFLKNGFDQRLKDLAVVLD